MPNNLTDAEIIKALECCIKWKREGDCAKCPLWESKKLCVKEIRILALDLINRRTTRLRKVEHQLDDALKMGETINAQCVSLEAEVERLRKENKLLIDNDVRNKYPNCVLVEKGRIYTKTLEDYEELIGDISAEAYKEFAELVHCHCESIINQEWNKKVSPVSWADAYKEFDNEVDNISNELVGGNNAKDG